MSTPTTGPIAEAFNALIGANHTFHCHWNACQDDDRCPHCLELLKAKSEAKQNYIRLINQQFDGERAAAVKPPLAHTAPKANPQDELMFLRKQAD
jgi:hypothetical protein